MTFEPKNDLWGPEGLRRCNPPALCAAEVVELAARSGWTVLPVTEGLASLTSVCLTAQLTRSWREMLCRKLQWAAFRLDAALRCVYLQALLRAPLQRWLEAAPTLFELEWEVERNGASCI